MKQNSMRSLVWVGLLLTAVPYLCRVLSDVPKATDPSLVKPADVSPTPTPPTPIKVKVKPPNRRSNLVSAMLRQRAVAHSLSAETGPPLPAVTQKPLSTAAAASVTTQVRCCVLFPVAIFMQIVWKRLRNAFKKCTPTLTNQVC